MEPANRIIVNTTVQYVKAVINTVLLLYSTRLVLEALTISDYGIYSVVAGVVGMLGFISNALVITTQRYISFYHGKGDAQEVRRIFKNSLLLHLVFGVLLAFTLLLIREWLFDDILNIPLHRVATAKEVYIFTVGILFLTVLTAPFKALYIARENIIYIAVVEVADAVIKVALAIWLGYVDSDKLLTYAAMLSMIVLMNLVIFACFALKRFEECSIVISRKDINRTYIRQLTGFAGWTTFGMGAVAGRNQGTAVILNHFFGTAVNAAYGIAFQVYGAVAFVVTSILNAMNPQIMKSEGENQRDRMLHLACMESKYSSMLLAIVAIPLIIEMPSILAVWLKEVPEHTSLFCRFILVGFICDQLTMGLQTANQAIGKIRTYTLLIYTPKLLYIPAVWLMLSHGRSIREIMWLYLAVELFVALLRIPYLRHKAGLSVLAYLKTVIVPLVPVCITLAAIGMLCKSWFDMPFGFILTAAITAGSGLVAAWFWALTSEEKAFVVHLINRKRHD